MDGMDGMGGMGDGMGVFMMVWMVLWGLVALAVLALAIAGSVWLIRGAGPGGNRQAGGVPAAEEVLRSRYAAGEIDEDEYRQRLSSLRG